MWILHGGFDVHFSGKQWAAHLFICLLLPIYMSSLVKCLSRSYAHFPAGFPVFVVVELDELLVNFGD